MGNKNVHIPASEVQIGDNVWEHNIVTSIREVTMHGVYAGYLLFNVESVSPWIAEKDMEVMVTNR